MSLLSGLFSQLEKASAPHFVISENGAQRTSNTHTDDGITLQPLTEDKIKPASCAITQTPVGEHHDNLSQITDDQPQRFIQTAATASTEWLTTRDAFYNHLMPCRACHAPVGRYCLVGAKLRQRYDQAALG